MKTRIKLQNFEQQSKLIEFITHLESVQDVVTFVLCPDSDAVLLEYDPVEYSTVYYYTWRDCYELNNPIVCLGRDCGSLSGEHLTEWDHEQLDMKGFIRQYDCGICLIEKVNKKGDYCPECSRLMLIHSFD